MIEGCLAWQTIGLAQPLAVKTATDDYLQDEDVVAAWIDERCEVGPMLKDPSSKLFASWADWAEKARLPTGNNKRFKEEMERLGYSQSRTSAGVLFLGLQIRQEEPPERRSPRTMIIQDAENGAPDKVE